MDHRPDPPRSASPRPRDAERAALLKLLALERPEVPVPSGGQPNWTALLDHLPVSLAPLVMARIARDGAPPDFPDSALERLRAQHMALTADYLRRQAALRVVLDALAGAGIPSLVLKGAALAHLVYPDPTQRAMCDIDLWVPDTRLDDAVAAVAQLGWRYPPDLSLNLEVASPAERLTTRVLYAPDPQPAFELHGRLRSLEGLPAARFELAWEQGHDASLAGVPARVQAPQQLLLHIGLHLARTHAFDTRLLHLVDIGLVVRRWCEEWPWARMLQDWSRQRVAVWMLLSLTLARDLIGAPVPADLETRVALPSHWPALRALAIERLWDAREHRLPTALSEAVQQRSLASKLAWARRRLIDHYWRSDAPRSALATIRDAGRHFWYDLSVKLPRHLAHWRGGALRGDALARGLALARDRAELERLVVASGDLGYPAPLSSVFPVDVE